MEKKEVFDFVKGAALVACGSLHGYTFGRCGVYSPQAMHDQMLFKNFIIMKLFISGVGSSMISQGILSIIQPKEFELSRAYAQTLYGSKRVVTGCFTLGVGMALAGSGPTMVPMQLAAGVGNAVPTLAGCVVGGLAYLMIEKTLNIDRCPAAPENSNHTMEKKFGAKSYAAVAIPLGAVMIAMTAAMEMIFPHDQELSNVNASLLEPWLPIIGGLSIGLGQIPLRLLSQDGQGGSRSILTAINLMSGGMFAPCHSPKSVQVAGQFLYMYVGAMLGTFYATKYVSEASPMAGFEPARSFLGGVMMLLGARYAGGCTCGHGISGFSELSLESLLGTCAIFGGGILSTFLLGL